MCTNVYLMWCYGFFFPKIEKFRKPKITDNIIHLEWHVLWVEAKKKKKKKTLQNYYAGVLNISSKVRWQMGASLIFTLTINSSAGFVYFEETFHFFFQDMRCE